MPHRQLTLLLVAGLLMPCAAQAASVQFDISSYLNYDAVATPNEMSANIPGNGSSLRDIIGDHNVTGGTRAYTNEAGVPGRGIPDDGVVGEYQFSTAFDNGTDYLTKSNNALAHRPNTGGSPNQISTTVDLTATAQQGTYAGINMAFVTDSSAMHGFHPYRTWIEATYDDSSSELLLDTGQVRSGDANAPGGYLGGGNQGGQGGLTNGVDTTSFANLAPNYPGTISYDLLLGMTSRLDRGGPNNQIRTFPSYIWEFADPLAVDSSKVLTSITINTLSPPDNINRDSHLYVFAINGVLPQVADVPEPASAALCCLTSLILISRRRRRTCDPRVSQRG